MTTSASSSAYSADISRTILRTVKEDSDQEEQYSAYSTDGLEHLVLRIQSPEKLPTFPVDVLPGWLQSFVAEVAEALQVPIDLPATLSLTALATAVGGVIKAEPYAGWREPLNLYAAPVLAPGTGKTPVHNEIVAPIERFELRESADRLPNIEAAKVRRKIRERELENLQNQASSEKLKEEERVRAEAEAITLAGDLLKAVVPPGVSMLADDATPEALGTLLSEQGRISFLSDEGSGLFGMMAGRYSQKSAGPNVKIYLQGHSGGTVRVRRQGRAPEFIKDACITIGTCIQPGMLRDLASSKVLQESGLLARFLFVIPEDTVGYRDTDAAPVTEATRDKYHEKMLALLTSMLQDLEQARENARQGEPSQPLLTFDGEAEKEIRAFRREVEPKLRKDGGEYAPIVEWASKLAGAVVRIAGLLHVARTFDSGIGWARPVGAEVVRDAILVGRYMAEHAVAAFTEITSPEEVRLAGKVITWVTKRLEKDSTFAAFTRQELFSSLSRRDFQTVEALTPVLALLQEHGYFKLVPAKPREPGQKGRAAGPTYHLNQDAFRGRKG